MKTVKVFINLWSVESKGTKQQIGVHTLYSPSFRVDGSHCHDDEQWLFSWIKVVRSFDRFVRCFAFVPWHHTDYSGWLIAFVSVDMLCVIVFNDTYLVEMCRCTHTYLRRLLSLSIHVPEGYSTCLYVSVCLSVTNLAAASVFPMYGTNSFITVFFDFWIQGFSYKCFVQKLVQQPFGNIAATPFFLMTEASKFYLEYESV